VESSRILTVYLDADFGDVCHEARNSDDALNSSVVVVRRQTQSIRRSVRLSDHQPQALLSEERRRTGQRELTTDVAFV